VYVYQGGIEPEAARVSPGQIATLFALRSAIERGDEGFDFLRGDELYKRRWHAGPRPTVELRVVADRAGARMRHGAWLAGLEITHWVKDTLESWHLH
jgi:CelD/BcsL family acetyltransferase involved in cellulose biosynthesis